jgi:hypothetical protein
MSIEAPAPAPGIATMSAKVHRVNWKNKPFFIPKGAWIFLKKCKVPGTYTIEDLGVIATEDDGSLQVR